jgi:hypothetical protein
VVELKKLCCFGASRQHVRSEKKRRLLLAANTDWGQKHTGVQSRKKRNGRKNREPGEKPVVLVCLSLFVSFVFFVVNNPSLQNKSGSLAAVYVNMWMRWARGGRRFAAENRSPRPQVSVIRCSSTDEADGIAHVLGGLPRKLPTAEHKRFADAFRYSSWRIKHPRRLSMRRFPVAAVIATPILCEHPPNDHRSTPQCQSASRRGWLPAQTKRPSAESQQRQTASSASYLPSAFPAAFAYGKYPHHNTWL